MKKILFLHSTLEVGGAEMLRLALLRNIDKKRYRIKLCCIGQKGRIGEEIERLGYRVDAMNQNPNSINLSIACKLIKYLKADKPDIVHCSLFYANFHGRLAGAISGINHLITEEHGEHKLRKLYKGIKFSPFIWIDFILSRLNDFIITCSEEVKKGIVEEGKLPAGKVLSIQNCLDKSIYKVETSIDDIKKKHRISDELVFIVVASLKPGKGHDYLIDVLREIRNAGHRFKCFFAGRGGPLDPELKDKCQRLNLSEDIIFLGNIENTMDYLNASDVFMLPSFSEGLSIALMEGMFMGLASIVTNVGSNIDLIQDGFNGILVSPGNKLELKEAIIFYFRNKSLIKEFGARSRSIIEAKYSNIDDYVKRYYEVWDKCINNKR
ncbi:glycosyltransferase [Candidatus Omnitrophota bacterium]